MNKPVKNESESVDVEVLRAIGLPADQRTIEDAKSRAELRGLTFKPEGLTTMVYPDKKAPKIISMDKATARKLSEAGAVRVII